MTTEILEKLDRLIAVVDTMQAALNRDLSPYVKGDKEAAKVAGFKSPAAFKRWAKRVGIRPERRGGLNQWDRVELLKGK